MWNSAIQALLTRTYMFNERMRDLQFHTNDFIIIWRINHNAGVIGNNIYCDVIKQPEETVSVG